MSRKSRGARTAPLAPTLENTTGLAAAGTASAVGGLSQGLSNVLTAGPSLPYTPALTLVRAPGGFIVFQAGGGDEDDPANAIGVAATPLALSVLIDDWAHKAAPAQYPA